MRFCRRSARGRLAGLGLAIACLAPAAPMAPAGADEQNPIYLPEAQQADWAKRLAEAQDAIEEASQRAALLEAEYARARNSKHPRGDARAALEEALSAARQELEDARRRLPLLVEEARRAGVYPEVLRPYQDR